MREHGRRHDRDGAPRAAPRRARRFDVAHAADLDPLCQIIEGVSHFVYLADRARVDREATQLELEMQAEVDKYVVLAAAGDGLDVRASAALRAPPLRGRLVRATTPTASAASGTASPTICAHAFVRRLERDFVATSRYPAMRHALRRFYRLGQEDKLRLARAA